jgi:hypothetical protein
MALWWVLDGWGFVMKGKMLETSAKMLTFMGWRASLALRPPWWCDW